MVLGIAVQGNVYPSIFGIDFIDDHTVNWEPAITSGDSIKGPQAAANCRGFTYYLIIRNSIELQLGDFAASACGSRVINRKPLPIPPSRHGN